MIVIMKATRKVFSVKGKESAVRTVLNGLMGFKAVTVLSDMVTPDAMSKVFKNNKNIVCRAEDISYSLMNADVVDVHATDSDMMIFGVKNIINVNGNIVRQFMEIAEEYDIDIGDHVSNTSTKSALKSDCLFCKLLDGKPVHEQASLYESKNFLVIPGSGAFLDGYIMILPKPHVMSCAELDLEQ